MAKVKVETFSSLQDALARVRNASHYCPTRLFMPADVYADENGLAWVIQDRIGRLLYENGVLG